MAESLNINAYWGNGMKKALMLAAALAAVSNIAAAADFGFYGYGSLGVARVQLDQGANDNGIRSGYGATSVSSSVNENPTAFKLQLGYQFDSTWAIEGGYTHIQKLNYDAVGRIGGSNVSFAASDKLAIWSAVAAVSLPLGSSGLQATGRLGVASAREELSLSAGGISLPINDESKTSLTYGLGLKYNLNQNVSLRADLDHYKAKDDDFNVWSVGAGYKF